MIWRDATIAQLWCLSRVVIIYCVGTLHARQYSAFVGCKVRMPYVVFSTCHELKPRIIVIMRIDLTKIFSELVYIYNKAQPLQCTDTSVSSNSPIFVVEVGL